MTPMEPLGSLQTGSAAVATKQVPVSVTLGADGIVLTVDNRQYTLTLPDRFHPRLLLQAQSFALPLAEDSKLTSLPDRLALALLGQTRLLPLPSALVEMSRQQGIAFEQLVNLASRPQGYPLPNATIKGGQISFENGVSIHSAQAARQGDGHYQVAVVQQGRQLMLRLVQILDIVQVGAAPLLKTAPEPGIKTQSGVAPQPPEAKIIITKPEAAGILNQLFKNLEQQPLPPQVKAAQQALQQQISQQPQQQEIQQSSQVSEGGKNQAALATAAKVQASNLRLDVPQGAPAATDKAQTPVSGNQGSTLQAGEKLLQTAPGDTAPTSGKEPAEKSTAKGLTPDTPPPQAILSKVLSRTGALPLVQLARSTNENIAGEVLRLLPELAPLPLSSLIQPQLLADTLKQGATVNLAQFAAPQLQGNNPLSILFQLLLGVKADTQKQPLSPTMKEYLGSLQQQTGLSQPLLALLERHKSLESLVQLGQSMAQYQQASLDNPATPVHWFFALPYQMGQRNEQMEGYFEREQEEEGGLGRGGWKLQLKFVLTQGPLLIKAQKSDTGLNLHFESSSESLLHRIENFLPPLATKLNELGLKPDKLTTKAAPIPATLLPGDHYLVHTRA
ncbi:hypothetical protein [Shewanella sedimentimangrovi]|uniref:Flagellar hook-length control protein-like C-terminal domain-containing protein n=1 Tax=Shewanella sedimentimangrovi TaxID=2814293 RepID=A0ABX7QZM2_9GAMM|nr:hypothetical protein [Shewanella sedimentimangrovi]QSX36051.1 hypothetical protein JYB85_11960 [Shewanella sedimentimangrovi]